MSPVIGCKRPPSQNLMNMYNLSLSDPNFECVSSDSMQYISSSCKTKIEMQEMMRGVRDLDDEEEEPQEVKSKRKTFDPLKYPSQIPGCWLCGREACETSDFYCEVTISAITKSHFADLI